METSQNNTSNADNADNTDNADNVSNTNEFAGLTVEQSSQKLDEILEFTLKTEKVNELTKMFLQEDFMKSLIEKINPTDKNTEINTELPFDFKEIMNLVKIEDMFQFISEVKGETNNKSDNLDNLDDFLESDKPERELFDFNTISKFLSIKPDNPIDLGNFSSIFSLFNTKSAPDNVSSVSSGYSTDDSDNSDDEDDDSDTDVDTDENLEKYSVEPQVSESKKIMENALDLIMKLDIHK
jgi:hypothetical protein